MFEKRATADSAEAPPEPRKAGGALRGFFRDLSIFVICDGVYRVLIGGLLSRLHGIDVHGMEIVKLNMLKMTEFLLQVSTLLALLIAWEYRVPLRLRTVWMIGIGVPPIMILIFWS